MKCINILGCIIIITAIALQSCVVGEKYKRPEMNLPTAYEADSLIRVDTIPAYKTFFEDPYLVSLLDSVIVNNLNLKVAEENILITEQTLRQVKLNYLPDLNLQLNFGLQRLSQNSLTGSFVQNLTFKDFTFGPTLSWEIDLWGRIKKQKEEALANYLSQAEARRGIRVQLIKQAALSYYSLLSLDEQLQIAQKVERTMDSTMQILQTQYEVGDVTSVAVKQAEAQLAETRSLIPEIKASIRAQEIALKVLSANYPAAVLRADIFEPSAKKFDAGVPAGLLGNRPDVNQAEYALIAANAQLGIAKTNFYPTVSITAQGGLNSIKASEWFSIPSSLFANAIGGLTQPLFNKKRIKAAYEQAKHQREASVHQFRNTVVTAVGEVSTELSNLELTETQMIEITNRRNAISAAVDEALYAYTVGEISYLEVLTIQQSYFQAELAYSALKLKQIGALINLYAAIGGE
ncbi:efflux transporter outer membrane subunit [Gynurincola endophyticus]|uniref:efflux transporter outer membrane subunit n=1 Tax=Gynurincola endophyticus TaxID=2479004 RepID=UPI000F8C4CD9|nr:efflux transporter outer membrane subunit [Gynurincola endophyticus]